MTAVIRKLGTMAVKQKKYGANKQVILVRDAYGKLSYFIGDYSDMKGFGSGVYLSKSELSKLYSTIKNEVDKDKEKDETLEKVKMQSKAKNDFQKDYYQQSHDGPVMDERNIEY